MRVPIYFLPGMLCDHRLWRPVAQELQRLMPGESWEANFVDFHGKSGDTMAKLANMVVDRAADRPGVIAGFSMGGHVAFELYRTRPDLVLGLVLCNTSAECDPPERREERERFLETTQSVGRFDGMTAREWPRYVAVRNGGDTKMLALVQSMARSHGVTGAKAQIKALLGRQTSYETLEAIADNAVPVSLCAGREDQITPLAQSFRMALSVQLQE